MRGLVEIIPLLISVIDGSREFSPEIIKSAALVGENESPQVKISTAESFIKKARESMGATMVSTSISGIRKLIDSLYRNNIIAIACDQVPAIKSGIHSNFFGVQALTMTLVVRLALKTKSPCHSVSYIRKKNGKGFQICFSEAIKELNILDVQEGVNHMNRQLEKCIIRAPEQYAWEYKRFKRSLFENPY